MRLIEIFETKDKYFAASDDLDTELNPESANYRQDVEDDSKKRHEGEGTPIVTDDEDNGEPDWTSDPAKDEYQSAGFRGREWAKNNAGLPHKKYQKYDPSYFVQDNPEEFYSR